MTYIEHDIIIQNVYLCHEHKMHETRMLFLYGYIKFGQVFNRKNRENAQRKHNCKSKALSINCEC